MFAMQDVALSLISAIANDKALAAFAFVLEAIFPALEPAHAIPR